MQVVSIDNQIKPVLSGLPFEVLAETLKPLPSFRAAQVFQWIARGVSSFHEMTDLAIPLREDLEQRFSLYSSVIAGRVADPDGTIKLYIRLHDGAQVEAVLLVDAEQRKTACLSTQAGCAMGCVFCKTGTRGLTRNLDSGEILEQFLHLRSIKQEHEPEIANIVFMGMGEPLLNLPELYQALAVLTDSRGLGISKRRITLSTSGIIAGIRDLAATGAEVRLALSLTTGDSELRARLMPVTLSNPLPDLKQVLYDYQQQQGRRITLEAVLLGGINTRQEDSDTLAAFASGLDVVVNLIPWNPVQGMVFEGRPLREPSGRELRGYMQRLEQKGLKVTRRLRKGLRIAGACGQLGT
ncbi:MAG: 23S rRNA (adenine(2503)-C(2))-methyltransferase RlmN [Treponema sp.]|jgi:23S rRNA (adenine2503-C2)-methyltransferase|nr:23S rRNA (adenine(2503)-C(2))-methyltransferase RlmN [Treponema sp.]